MIPINEIIDYVNFHNSELFLVASKENTSKDVTDKIDSCIQKINSLGGTKKVTRIVIGNIKDDFDKVIYLQSEDNGDNAIFIIAKEYPYTQSLVEGLSVYCQANDLIYSKI